jgi:ER-bound oxygenase mpaB/B'/Rubber oxygenase, catalytic domain
LADTTFSAGLIERSAAAFAAGMPDGAGDDGFFGPASVTWRMSAGLAWPVAGLRSLLMQALHPLAMAGVDQHSGWRRDPVGRLAATTAYLATVTFGDRASAPHAAGRVRRIHEHVRGVDAVTGRPYAAGDPALLLWVHGALVDSVLAAGNLVGTALPAADSNRYVAEMAAGEQRQLLREDLALRTAEDVAGTLGAMEGVMMKIGQMASYIDDGLSPAVRHTLGRLQDSVPPMSPQLAAAVVEEELGAPLSTQAVTGAGPAAGRARLPGRRGLPGDQLPVRAAGLGPGRMAGRRLAAGQER